MRPELLEPLLLDRALGELPPEVAALLDEHLARDPNSARQAAELDKTLMFARAVTRLDAEAPVPALDAARLHDAARSEQAATRRSQWFRLAACLALGAIAGWLARPVPAPTIVAAPAAAALAATTPRPLGATPAGLWSRSRIVSEQSRERSVPPVREARPPAHPPSASDPFRNEKL
jgi:anti-sigma factor RsiW